MSYSRQNPQKLAVPTLLVLLLCGVNDTNGRVKNCEDCSPHSLCRIVTQDGVSMTTCLCPQGWLGESCRQRVWLSLVEVSMDSVSLQINVDDDVHTTKTVSDQNSNSDLTINNHDVYLLNNTSLLNHGVHNYILSSGSDKESQEYVSTQDSAVTKNKFSLHYWLKDNSEKCNIISDLQHDLITVFSLNYDSPYIFCIYTTREDLCAPRTLGTGQISSSESNCIIVTTGPDPNEKSFMYSIILGVVCGFCLVALVILTVIFIRKYGLSQLTFCLPIRRATWQPHKTVRSEIQMGKLEYDDPPTDMNLSYDTEQSICLLNSTENQRVIIHPPKQRGKPKHQLMKQRAHGYAAFAAKNELTIPLSAVVEYEDETFNKGGDDACNDDDNICDDDDDYRDDAQSYGDDLRFTDEADRSVGSFHSFKAIDS